MKNEDSKQDQENKLETDIETKLSRLSNTIEVARNCGFRLPNSHKLYVDARSLRNAGNIPAADDKAWETHNAIHDELEEQAHPPKSSGYFSRITWRLKYYIFKGKTYGVFSLIITCIFLLAYIKLLFNYTTMDIDKIKYLEFFYFTIPSTVIGIPLWAALLGGIGACAQIFYKLIDDVYYHGIVRDENYFRYVILPLMSPILGYIAYILMDLGVMALGGSKSEAALSAGDVQIESRIIICFLAGFATSNFLKKINEVTEYLFGKEKNQQK